MSIRIVVCVALAAFGCFSSATEFLRLNGARLQAQTTTQAAEVPAAETRLEQPEASDRPAQAAQPATTPAAEASVATTVPPRPAVDRTKLAATRPADVDGDFAWQGEYQGTVLDADGIYRQIGLQVVALGDGQFAGVRYHGGLPGTGWNRRDKQKLTGHRERSSLLLTGESRAVEVAPGRAVDYGADGVLRGSLPKVARYSPTLGQCPPSHAQVLFDGRHTACFKNGRINDEGLLEIGTELVRAYRDFTMHVEFRLPYMPYARDQGRANSGIYLQSRYEVQVLDSFGLDGAFNECGSLYRMRSPDVNMCLPPLAWQTYDITFRSPRFDRVGHKQRNAQLTVHHNGVLVQNHVEVENKTGAGKPESPELLPIKFQDHGNPVNFRNIWIIEL